MSTEGKRETQVDCVCERICMFDRWLQAEWETRRDETWNHMDHSVVVCVLSVLTGRESRKNLFSLRVSSCCFSSLSLQRLAARSECLCVWLQPSILSVIDFWTQISLCITLQTKLNGFFLWLKHSFHQMVFVLRRMRMMIFLSHEPDVTLFADDLCMRRGNRNNFCLWFLFCLISLLKGEHHLFSPRWGEMRSTWKMRNTGMFFGFCCE